MIKKITITFLTFVLFVQTAIAEEKNNKINEKLNQFLKCINEKIDDTKDYQVKNGMRVNFK